MGTADYIAPEQAADPRTADIRADIYSLACTLFHLLTGKPPFSEGSPAEKFKHHAETPLPIPAEWPTQLQAVVRRMTAKKPEERYATPAQVATALSLLPQQTRPRRAGTRHHRTALAASLLVLAAFAIAALIIIRIQTDKREIVIRVDDSSLEIVTRKGGEIVRIRDPKTGQAWELDTRHLTIRDLERPDGFTIKLDGRGELTFKSAGGTVSVSTGPPSIVVKESEFRPLFNGQDLTGWVPEVKGVDPKLSWEVKDKVLATKGLMLLRTERSYANFELRFEWRTSQDLPLARVPHEPISIRLFMEQEPQEKPAYIQVTMDMDGKVKGRPVAPGRADAADGDWYEDRFKPAEWNHVALVCKDNTVRVHMNGRDLGQFAYRKPTTGYIGLAGEPGARVTEFRNIEIKEFRPAESTRPIRTTDPGELAKLPNAADGLNRADIPKDALYHIGGGDPENVPPELVAVLGDTRFRCYERLGPMAFSPDGKQIAVTDDQDRPIRFFDAQTGRLLRQIPSRFRFRMAFSPDGRHLAGTTVGGKFSVIDAETGRLIWELSDTKVPIVDFFAFGSDGTTVAVCCKTAKAKPIIEIRNASTGKLVHSVDVGDPGAGEFAFSRDGETLVYLRRDSGEVMYVGRTKNGTLRHGERGSRIAFSSDGKHFAVSWRGDKEANRIVSIYDADGQVVHDLAAQAGEHLAFTADGKTLVAVHPRGTKATVTRWDVVQGKKLSEAGIDRPPQGFDAVSPDGKTLARQWEDSCQIDLFDTETGKPLHPGTRPAVPMTALAFSPNGKYLASSDRYGTKLWDLATCREVVTWKECPAHRLAFSPDGKVLALGGATAVFVHQVPDGKRLHMLYTKGLYIEGKRVESLAFSPDGVQLAATGGGDDVRVWLVADGKPLRILLYPKFVKSVTYSPDGSKLIAAGSQHIRVWDSLTGVESKDIHPECNCTLIGWLPDGKTLAVDGIDKTGEGIRHVELDTGKVVRPQPGARPSHLIYDASPGARFVCAGAGDTFFLTHLGSHPERQRVIRLGPSRGTAGVPPTAFSPDGRYLACGNSEGVISLLRLSELGKVPELKVRAPTARELAERPNAADALKHEDVPETARAYVGGGDPKKAPPELVGVLGDAAFRCPHGTGRPAYSPDGKLLAVPGDLVQLFDAATGRFLQTVNGHYGPVGRVVFSPDAKTVALLSSKGIPEIVELSTGRQVWKLPDGQLPLPTVYGVAFSLDGKLIALGKGRESQLVEVREIVTNKVKHSSDLPEAPGMSELVFSPDGKMLVLCGSGWFYNFWDLTKGGDPVRPSAGGHGYSVAFSQDGKRLATASVQGQDQGALVYDGKGTFVRRLPGRAVSWVAFSPDGQTLLAVCKDAKGRPAIGRWNVEKEKEIETVPLTGVAEPCHYAFSPDAKSLAVTKEGERWVCIFDTATGKPRRADPSPGHTIAIRALAFSHDGQRLVSRSDDGTVIVWDPTVSQPVKASCLVDAKGLSALSRDGLFAAAPRSDNLTRKKIGVYLYNLEGVRFQFLPGHAAELTDLAFSPDGMFLASASLDQTVRLWRIENREGQEVATIGHAEKVLKLAWSPDGRYLASLDAEGTLIVRETATGQLHRQSVRSGFPAANTVPPAFAFDAAGDQVAFLTWTSSRWQVHLFDWKAGKIARRLSGPADNVYLHGATFGPDLRLVTAARDDGILAVWQPGTDPLKMKKFPLSARALSAVAFSPDGRYLAVGDQAGVVSILRLAERGQVPVLP
jgi:WD40 repeat protein